MDFITLGCRIDSILFSFAGSEKTFSAKYLTSGLLFLKDCSPKALMISLRTSVSLLNIFFDMSSAFKTLNPRFSAKEEKTLLPEPIFPVIAIFIFPPYKKKGLIKPFSKIILRIRFF